MRAILQSARSTAYAATNGIMVEAYWKIGQRIVLEEQRCWRPRLRALWTD